MSQKNSLLKENFFLCKTIIYFRSSSVLFLSKLTYFVLVVKGDRDERTLIGLIAFLIIMFPLRIYAEEWNELTGLLDDSLQLVKRNEDEKAVQVLQHFSEQFLIKGNEKKQEVTPDQVRVISLAYDKAQQSLSEEGLGKQAKIDNVLALQLAVDAQVSKYQPLWMERERKVMDAFSQMEKRWKKKMLAVSTNVKYVFK